MLQPDAPFVSELREAATAAQRAEIDFRNSFQAQVERLERERRHAYRRLDIAGVLHDAALGAESEEAARLAQIAALKHELGWYSNSEERQTVFAALEPALVLIRRQAGITSATDEGDDAADPGEASVRTALLAFEAWYLTTFGAPFLDILHEEMAELPVVEF